LEGNPALPPPHSDPLAPMVEVLLPALGAIGMGEVAQAPSACENASLPSPAPSMQVARATEQVAVVVTATGCMEGTFPLVPVEVRPNST
jgi:hypothetical protein